MDREYIEENLLNKLGSITNTTLIRLNITYTVEELYKIYTGNSDGVCYCGKETKFKSFLKGYATYCSPYCNSHSSTTKDKIKATNETRYGGHPQQNKEVRDKANTTNNLRYGGNSPSCSQEVRKKQVASILDKYGVDNISKHPYVKEKKKETCLKNYGVEIPIFSEEVKNKSKETNILKYGKEYASQSSLFKSKMKVNLLEKYGVDHISKLDTTKKKLKSTNVAKGVWLDSSHLSDFERYKRLVWSETHKHKKALLNFELRGKLSSNKDSYHIDHKYSILEGFKNGVLPTIIGNKNNLIMVPGLENIQKGSKCSEALENILPDTYNACDVPERHTR